MLGSPSTTFLVHFDLTGDTSAQQRPERADAKNDPHFDQGNPGEERRTIGATPNQEIRPFMGRILF
jgi:hypothetical protein